jgi:hypothetical protein
MQNKNTNTGTLKIIKNTLKKLLSIAFHPVIFYSGSIGKNGFNPH